MTGAERMSSAKPAQAGVMTTSPERPSASRSR